LGIDRTLDLPDSRGNDRESDSTSVLLYGSHPDDEEAMTMNLNTIYKHVREMAGETAWILEKIEEYEREVAIHSDHWMDCSHYLLRGAWETLVRRLTARARYSLAGRAVGMPLRESRG
jgi:hypothetical protein